jgi:hypothetical protein
VNFASVGHIPIRRLHETYPTIPEAVRSEGNFRVGDETLTVMLAEDAWFRLLKKTAGRGEPHPFPRTLFPNRNRFEPGMPSIEIVRATHAMTLPLLDRVFDVIFVVAGDNKASIVHELFKVRKGSFKYPVELVQPKSRIALCLGDNLAEVHRQRIPFSEIQRSWKRVSFDNPAKLIC